MPDRDLETEIADFLVGEDGSALKGLPVDFAFGGGRCFFLPNGTADSCRTNQKDLLAVAKEKGIKVVQGMADLREYHERGGDEGTVLGLFANDVSAWQQIGGGDRRSSISVPAAHGLRDRPTEELGACGRAAESQGDVSGPLPESPLVSSC